ncbi:MAG: hypothetical protein ACXWDA_00985, partial [Aeromicrobium sp.]
MSSATGLALPGTSGSIPLRSRDTYASLGRSRPHGSWTSATHHYFDTERSTHIMAEIHQFTVATVAEQSPDFRRVLWT